MTSYGQQQQGFLPTGLLSTAPSCPSSTAAQTADLWLKVDQLHLNFLKAEQGSKKLEIRNKLEGLVWQYLCLVPQERRFCNPVTAEVVADSASWMPDFSASRAAQAFGDLETYAANLLNLPWRKEFKEIKKYCGFYIHNVENALHGADRIFHMMGYRSSGPEILVLEGPVDHDKVTIAARDCLLAMGECKILLNIVQGVSSQHPCSWIEALNFRRDHIGSPEQAIRSIIYSKSQLQYQSIASAFIYSGDQPRILPMGNGICHPPTGKLVDIGGGGGSDDSSYERAKTPTYASIVAATNGPTQIPLTIKHLEEENRRKSVLIPNGGEANNGGDSWDYVYRQLERIGYTKDQSERPDVLTLLNKVRQRDGQLSREEQELLLRQLQRTHLQKEDNGVRNNAEEEVNGQEETDAVHHRFRNKENKVRSEQRRSLRHSRPLEPPPLTEFVPTSASERVNTAAKWECYACTYANSLRVEICEMCGKSRVSPDTSNATSGEESSNDCATPGGAADTDVIECQKCTLVNPRKHRVCEACGATLQGKKKRNR